MLLYLLYSELSLTTDIYIYIYIICRVHVHYCKHSLHSSVLHMIQSIHNYD